MQESIQWLKDQAKANRYRLDFMAETAAEDSDHLLNLLEAIVDGKLVPAPEIPNDIRDALRLIGPVDWGATEAKTNSEHADDLQTSLRLTDEYFGQEGMQRMHGVYIKDTGIVMAHTGTSPNSAARAKALTGMWNWLVELVKR